MRYTQGQRGKAVFLQCAWTGRRGRGSHSRCAQWLFLFLSWLTRVKVEFLYLFFLICFFPPPPLPQMLYKRIFSGLEQVQGKKASIVIQENEKK